MPPPQVTVQVDKELQAPQFPSKMNKFWQLYFRFSLICSKKQQLFNSIFLPMGHSCALHETLSEPNPGQAAPPLDGAGLLQSLV
jgi:hypothetical protein